MNKKTKARRERLSLFHDIILLGKSDFGCGNPFIAFDIGFAEGRDFLVKLGGDLHCPVSTL